MNVTGSNKIDLVPSVIISGAVFIVFIFLGTLLPAEISSGSLSQLKEIVTQLQGMGSVALLVIIFFNNAFKCMIVIFTGIVLGLPPVVYIGINASLIGMLIANSQGIGPAVLIAGLAPHGIIEIPAFLFSAALGIAVGQQAYKFITRQESAVRMHLRYSLNFFFKWIVPALLIASLIEVFVTPAVIAQVGGNTPPVLLP